MEPQSETTQSEREREETATTILARHLAQTFQAVSSPPAGADRNVVDEAERAGKAVERFVEALLEALAEGNTALQLTAETAAWLRQQPWVSDGSRFAPVILKGTLAQFHRYWLAEQTLAAFFDARVGIGANSQGLRKADIDPAETAPLDPEFRAAADAFALEAEKRTVIARALTLPVALLTGGPGTGKTTTLAWFLAAALRRHPEMRIALAAPTGKAAQRMGEALTHVLPELPLSDAAKACLCALTPLTLHRLLGIGRRPEPSYHAQRPLPYDLVVVDEASMVDVLLLAKLVRALPATAQLLLIGDPNQLASVEAGNVLADLVARYPNCHLPLSRSHRFTAAIGAFADAVIAGNGDAAWQMLSPADEAVLRSLFASHEFPKDLPPLRLQPTAAELFAAIDRGFQSVLAHLAVAPNGSDFSSVAAYVRTLFARYRVFRLLSPLRHDRRYGVRALNARIAEHWHRAHRIPFVGTGAGRPILLGQPITIESNDYSLSLFNGDQGVVFPWLGTLFAWFLDADAPHGVRPVPLAQLPHWESAWALTVHKAQGSEFDAVLLVLPAETVTVATRELLYTAITRAKRGFVFWGTEDAFRAAVANRTVRVSGLGGAVVGSGASAR